MQKRTAVLISMIFSFFVFISVFAKDDEWKTKPTITHVYELSKENVSVEWEGYSDLYKVYVDGKEVANVNIENASVELKSGVHQIIIMPVNYEKRDADTNVGVQIGAEVFELGGNIDLAALGINPKDLQQGNKSDSFKINYSVSPIFNAVPEISNITTDFEDRLLLSFTDKYDSDIYEITVKSGNDINYVEFARTSEEASDLISKSNTSVTVTLDQDYLRKHGCMIPELNQKYGFFVKLIKWPKNYVDNSQEKESFIESKDSKEYTYTPYAAWKNAPEITYASQTADGQITLKWEHNDNGLGCEYIIMKSDKILMVKKGDEEIGRTSDKEYIINDLLDGKYTYSVIPAYSGEQGIASNSTDVEIKNSWSAAPSLKCEAIGNKQVRLEWPSQKNIDTYHVVVSASGSSVLKVLNLDYKVCEEFDIPAEENEMSYTYTYDQNADADSEIKLKFEVYGYRYAANGEQQKSETAAKTISIK